MPSYCSYKGLMLLLELALIPLNEIWKVMSPVILFVVDALLKVLGAVFWLIDRLDELDDAWEVLKDALDSVKEKWDEIWGGIKLAVSRVSSTSIIDGINTIIKRHGTSCPIHACHQRLDLWQVPLAGSPSATPDIPRNTQA